VPPGFAHRELLLLSPTKDSPDLSPLTWNVLDPFGFKIHQATDGCRHYTSGSVGHDNLESMISHLVTSSTTRRSSRCE